MSVDDWLIALFRGTALTAFLVILGIVAMRLTVPITAETRHRTRIALVVSLIGWAVTQGVFFVMRTKALIDGAVTPHVDVQGLVIGLIAAIVGLTYVWAWWPGGRPPSGGGSA